jgi:predicted pyridoxine 5'-phosphate oxidase superfamily flavin-nucleotide-binding protein
VSKFYEALTPEITEFIESQPVFFTATAPEEGRINLSPKGMDTFRVLDPGTVAYLDITGSGNETATHLRQNGRITLMFCSFGVSPRLSVSMARARWCVLATPSGRTCIAISRPIRASARS